MSTENIQTTDTGEEPTMEEHQPTWEELCEKAKANYFVVKTSIDHREEPLKTMTELSEFIERVVEDPNCFGDNKEFKNFFYQDCALGLLKRLNKERSADPQYLELIAVIMKQFIRLFAKDIHNPDLAECMRFVFDYNCTLHNFHYEDEEMEMKILEQKKQEHWRKDLKTGDKIDALKGDEKCKCWSVAKVVDIKDDNLELEFEQDSRLYDKSVNKYSSDIAQLGEFSVDQDWKKELKKGDQVDGFDKAKVWYASTILDFKDHTDPDGRSWTMVLIGFRLYHSEGTKSDEDGNKFDGWSARFDEWISLWSPKIAKLHTHSNPKGRKGIRQYDDVVIDDSSDPSIKEGDPMIYAVIRPKKSKSYLLNQWLNLFGELGGYDKMLDKMTDKDHPIDFELLAYYMDCIGKVFPMYHREFIAKFAFDVKAAVQNAILNAPEASIRNVRREKIEGIVNRLSDLLKRVFNYEQREIEIEHLNLDIVLMCLKSNFLERRIQGIKSLAEVLANLKQSRNSKVSSEYMLEWLNKYKILDLIFDSKNYHVQIIQRSKEILKFLVIEDKLSNEQLNLFWKATEFDDETRREIYKIIEEISTPMQNHHVMQFLTKFEEEKNLKVIPETVNCIYEMGKFSKDTSANSKNIANILWRFSVDQNNPLDVSNLAISKFWDLLKKWKFSTAKSFFYSCIENLKAHKASIESIKVMRRIFKEIDYFRSDKKRNVNSDQDDYFMKDQPEEPAVVQAEPPVEEQEDELGSPAECIIHFIDKENLLEIYLENFVNYSKVSQTKLHEVKEKVKVQEHIFEGRYDHKTNITERLEFLKFLAAHSNYTISRKEVDVIWNCLIDESKIEFDEEAVFKWLRESCENEVGSAQVWHLQDIGDVFNERLGKGSNDMKSLTLDGFYCIQSYFLLANETAEKLKRVKKVVQKSNNLTSFCNTTGAQFSTFTFNRQRKKPEEVVEESGFRVFVPPKDLEGVSTIWKIIIESQNADVQQKAIKFLVELYHNLSPSIEENKREINYECLETAIQYLKDIQKDVSKSEETKCSQIISILRVFDEFLAQSERKGTTGLKQQRSLLKGELLNKIQVTNSVSYNKLIGRKIELSLYSNTTIYDIKRIIGAINKVPAEYVRLIRYSTTSEIKDIDNGKTLADLNFKSNESLIANKQNLGNITKAPLLNPDKSLTKEAKGIFGEWFDMFSHEGLMTPEDCVEFIRSCTDDKCKTTDTRVKNLFQNHDHDGDGKVEKEEFIEFYRQACIRKEEVVRANILAHNYRNDLKKISDMCEENSDKTVLPRYILSHKQEYFETLFSLLDRPDESSKEAWNLIQKLVTNPSIQNNILNLNVEKREDGTYDWSTLIDTNSIFKLLYMFQIIESLIEEGGETEQEICKVYKNKDTSEEKETKAVGPASKKPDEEENEKQLEKDNKEELERLNRPAEYFVSELLASNEKDPVGIMKQESEIRDLKRTWIFRFLERRGFEFSYDLFSANNANIKQMNSFQKNFLGFLLKILRIFITSAFLAVEPEVANIVTLVKKQSNIKESVDVTEKNEERWTSAGKSDDEENIFSAPAETQITTGSFGADSQHFVTEDYILGDQNLDEFDSDRHTIPAEDEQLKKNTSTFSKKQKENQDTVDKKIEQLATQLKGEFGDNLLKVIDFDQLQMIVLQSIASLLEKQEIDFDERKIVENSLSLWLGCVLHNPKILDNFFTFKCNEFSDVKDFMQRGILYPSLFRVREEFLYTLYVFATKISKSKIDTFEYTLKSMLQKLPKDNEGEESCTSQYFELVSKLIEEYFNRVNENKLSNDILDAPKFFADVINRIKSHQSREVRNSPRQDETLIGYLKIAHMVLDRGGLGECVNIAINNDFISELFQKCLFPNNLSAIDEDVTEGTDLAQSLLVGNKCKTEESRKWAYKLLWTLCNNSPKLLNEVIEKQMFPLCNQIKLYPGWNYIPSGDSKSGKYSGIRNLGCICYMNSMLQQLYHVPAFRYQLLQADDGAAPDWKEYKGRTIDDNVLHQLQRLFGHLELSERVDYNPIEFCFSFKEMDGSPTNTSVQHDTEEFFNIIFDRIENLIKPTPQKYLLQSVFGGKNCSQMVCKECGFIRNRFEDFYNLSLTVKERKSVEESLRKNLEGEVISDYECPGCKKKVDITKRTLFSQTPNVFVVQLQRIVFDFDRFENQKVNTFFEFPDTLDLTPFSLNHIMKAEGKLSDKDLGTEEASPDKKEEQDGSESEGEDEYEGLTEEEKKERIEEKQTFQNHVRFNENECYEYKLVGVIIHVGTADAGHYYSLINTDRFCKTNEQDEEWLDTSKDKWMEFNDSHVRDYNFEDLKGDCYGGSSGNDDLFGGFFKSSSYGKSAYLLVYEKRFKKPIKVCIPEQPAAEEGKEEAQVAKQKQIVPADAVITVDPKTNEKSYSIPMNEVKLFVPKNIYKEIWEDNLEFSFEKLIYSKEFYEFVKELMLGTLKLKERENTLPEDEAKSLDKIISNMTTVGNKLVLEVLAKAFYNYKMAEVSDILIKLYEASDEAVMSTMRHIMANENSGYMLYVFQVLLNCSDKISRINTAKIVSSLVNRCFVLEKDILNETETVRICISDEELIGGSKAGEGEAKELKYVEITRSKSMAVRFWDLTMMALREKAPSSWSKFDHFLTMMRDIITGGDIQVDMVMERGGLIEFVDFMLGQNSPNCKPGERRPKMGSVYGNPNFGPLLEAVSFLILRCHTPTFTEGSQDIPKTAAKGVSKYYELTDENIQNFFLNEEFLKIAILNSCENLGEAFAHLSYKNLEVSKVIGKVILKIINTSDYEKIKNWMVVTKPFLYIEDEFQRNRAEWILGYSCLSAVSASQNVLPKFGVATINQVSEEVFSYLSPLDLTKNNDALLALLWRYRGKMDFYVVNCLNILLEIIVENDFLSEYMFNTDPPTYEYARFTDWFRPYLLKELEKARRNMAYRHSTKKEESVVKCFSYLELYESKLRKYERRLQGLPEEETAPAKTEENEETGYGEPEAVIQSYPKRYIVGCTRKVEEIFKEERDGIVVTVHKIFMEYAESQPTSSRNLTLPSYAFYNCKLDSEEYDRRNYQQHIKNLGGEEQAESTEDQFDRWPEDNEKDPAAPVDQHVVVSSMEGDADLEVQNKGEKDSETLPEGEENEKNPSDWNLPKNVGDVVIVASVNNQNNQAYNFRMKFICDDDASKENIKCFVNDIETTLRPFYSDMWMCVHKVFPEKDWGQFHIEWSFEEKLKQDTMQRSANYNFNMDSDVTDAYAMLYGQNVNMQYYSFV